jgi:hypothetical protein
MTLNTLRSLFYSLARFLGDVNALRRGRIRQRLGNRIVGRIAGRLLRRIFR